MRKPAERSLSEVSSTAFSSVLNVVQCTAWELPFLRQASPDIFFSFLSIAVCMSLIFERCVSHAGDGRDVPGRFITLLATLEDLQRSTGGFPSKSITPGVKLRFSSTEEVVEAPRSFLIWVPLEDADLWMKNFLEHQDTKQPILDPACPS